jgi:hypothetical protein
MTELTVCDGTTTATTTTADDDALPVQPFTALRAAYGMLLGEDDFHVLMGNPRGKQMMHTAWLHGSGVIWGFDVVRDKERLRVRPGLAVDRRGRELRLEVSQCLDLAGWATEWLARYPPKDGQDWVHAYVVAEFNSCLDRPVPALADPCDVTRRHDSPSRVVETTRIRIIAKPPAPPDPRTYHRLKVLLGLRPADPANDPDVLKALDQVRGAQTQDRPAELLRQFRRMAALDATQRRPGGWTGDEQVPQFPVDEAARSTEDESASGVLLARLAVPAKGKAEVRILPEQRPVLLPTALIQELLCGLAPGVFGSVEAKDAGGPRLVDVGWAGDRRSVELRFDKRIARNSWEEGAIEISSVSPSGQGWRQEHINKVRHKDNDQRTVVVRLDGTPAYSKVRVLVRGTGATPLFGRDPFVPFAGWRGGPPGSAHEGHDAAHNSDLPSFTGNAEGN